MNKATQMDLSLFWSDVLNSIKNETGETHYNAWFANSYAVRIDREGTLVIGVPNDFTKQWLQDNYLNLIKTEIVKKTNKIKVVKITVQNKKQKRNKKIELSSGSLPLNLETVNPENGLNPRFTFKNFIAAPYIQFAFSASQTVVDKPGIAYNPYFIHGPTGVGKTHLIQAIGNKFLSLNQGLKCFYVTAEDFTESFVSALLNNQVQDFRKKFKQYNLLIIDDVQFFEKTERTTQELFHLFNHMYNNNYQIVFSSDRHPNSLSSIEDRVRSRFSSGIILDIQTPDKESMEIVLKKKVEYANLDVEPGGIEYIIDTISGTSIRDVESVLQNISMYYEIHNKPLNILNIKSFIKNNIKQKPIINFRDVVSKVCEYFDVNEKEINTKSRKREVVTTRQIIMYILREHLDYSYSLIGKKLGNKDHTTVMHACEKIMHNLETDNKLQQDFDHIKRLLNI